MRTCGSITKDATNHIGYQTGESNEKGDGSRKAGAAAGPIRIPIR